MNMKPLSLSCILQNVLDQEFGYASSEETYHQPKVKKYAEQSSLPDPDSKIDDGDWFCEENVSPSTSSSASSNHSQISIEPIDSIQTLSSSLQNPSCLLEYEYPLGYFEALMNDAKTRLKEASEFYYSVRAYTRKFEFHISILRDLFTELGTPPRHFPTDDYTKLMKLRHNLRNLEFNLSARRDLLLQHERPCDIRDEKNMLNLVRRCSVTEDAVACEKDVTDVKISRQRQFAMASLLQKITNLSLKEEQYRQRRLEAEAEFRRFFDDDLVTPASTFQKIAHKPPEPDIVIDTSLECGNKPTKNDLKLFSFIEESKKTSTDFGSTNHQYSSVINKTHLKPATACTFCGELHWSHLCLQKPTLEERKRYYRERNMCLMCGRSHRGTCLGGDKWCKWPQCAAKNEHHSAVCPNVEYPISADHLRAYEVRIKKLERISKPSKFRVAEP